MKLALHKVGKYGFNVRPKTEEDFYAICEAENIIVMELDVSTSFYMCVMGQSIIVLKKKLRGIKRLFSMFHELAHHFLHGGKDVSNAFFYGMNESKQEAEADALATIALIPESEIDNYEFLEFHPNKFARKIFNDRKTLKFLYGI